jgi:hypothetical protein
MDFGKFVVGLLLVVVVELCLVVVVVVVFAYGLFRVTNNVKN